MHAVIYIFCTQLYTYEGTVVTDDRASWDGAKGARG